MPTKTNDAEQETREFAGEVKVKGKPVQIKMVMPASPTTEQWCKWWEDRATFGDLQAPRANPGTVLRAKFLAYCEMMVSCSYTDDQGSHNILKEKTTVPGPVAQWVNLQADLVMNEVWEVPQP